MADNSDFKNPYASHALPGSVSPEASQLAQQAAKSQVMGPAICMMFAAILGGVVAAYGTANAVLGKPPPVPPNASEFEKNLRQGRFGPVAAAIQGFFVGLNGLVVLGSIQMLRLKTWGLAMTASILSIANLGNGCCLLGMPFGIWGLVTLMRPMVKQVFMAPSSQI